MPRRTLAAALAVLPLLGACSAIQSRLAIRNCKFDLRNVAVKRLDLTGATLGVLLGITNPNTVEAILDRLEFDLYLDDVLVAKSGGRNPAYREEQAIAVMKQPEFAVRALLNRGRAQATVWTCDFSFDYVKINAEYRT